MVGQNQTGTEFPGMEAPSWEQNTFAYCISAFHVALFVKRGNGLATTNEDAFVLILK